MSNYYIENITKFTNLKPEKTYLVLIGIDKVPFHIALISNFEYFSLSSNGVKLGVNAQIIINSLLRKSIPTLVLSLSLDVENSLINLEYSKYSKLNKGQSCLLPIKKILNAVDLDLLNSQYAFDLLQSLYEMNFIEETKSINYNQSNLELVKYAQDDIDLAIKNAAQLC